MSEQNDVHQEEIEIEAIGIEVSSAPIELYKVFKIANLVGGGGEAKHIISEGYVAVNGELETRKRRKIYDGDLIEFNQEYYVVIVNAETDLGEQWLEDDALVEDTPSFDEIEMADIDHNQVVETDVVDDDNIKKDNIDSAPKKKQRKSLDFL